jgi:hypothetical protein
MASLVTRNPYQIVTSSEATNKNENPIKTIAKGDFDVIKISLNVLTASINTTRAIRVFEE